MKRVTKEQFKEWAENMYDEYMASNYCCTRCSDKKTIIVFSKHGNKIGKASCHKDDIYEFYIGVAIAYARAAGKEVPTVIEEIGITKLKYGDKFIYRGETYTYIAVHPLNKVKHVVAKKDCSLTWFVYWTKVEKI